MTKSKETASDVPVEPYVPPPPPPGPPPLDVPPGQPLPEQPEPPPGTAPMNAPTTPPPTPSQRDAGTPAQVVQPALQVLPPTDAQYAWFAANPTYTPISASLARYHSRGTLSIDGTFTPEGPGTPVMNSTDGSFGVGIPG